MEGVQNVLALLGLIAEFGWVCRHEGWPFFEGDDHTPSVMLMRVCHSAAGFYEGYFCPVCGPYHRCWDHYHKREEDARRALSEYLMGYLAYEHPRAYTGPAFCEECLSPDYDPRWLDSEQGGGRILCLTCLQMEIGTMIGGTMEPESNAH